MKFNEFNYMSAALEIFAAAVTAVMLIGCFLERKHKTKSGKLFVWCLISQTAMLLVDAPIWILLANPKPENVIPIKILSFSSDAFLCVLISLYAYCLTEYINERKKISYGYTNLITVLCGISLVLWLINAFNGMYIYYDATGLDQTGPHYLLSQAEYMDLGVVRLDSGIEYSGSGLVGGDACLPRHYRFACACLYIDPCGTG